MKRVAIIGGGISGLACLHYLKKRFERGIEVTLYERQSSLGGCIATRQAGGFCFETGPNGFLSNQPRTLELVDELGLSGELIEADQSSKRRYIQLSGQLHLLPSDPGSFFKTPLLSTAEKFCLIKGMFNKNVPKDQSIYDYTSARFGLAVTQRLVDPFLTGIYAGDIKRLHMSYAFPKMGTPKGQPKAKMCSFKNGMGSLIDSLQKRYHADIKTGLEIKSLDELKADTTILAVPAHIASGLLGMDILNGIYYAPVAVVGLLFKNEDFKKLPDGFGYLVPSDQGKEILGVLIESNVFKRQSGGDRVFVRVMLGGAHHPSFARYSEEEVLRKAQAELDGIYGLNSSPLESHVKIWPRGIPQYNMDYPDIISKVEEQLKHRPSVRLCANYYRGISFNDSIKNAAELVESL